mgnify:CR=1 FL=1
MVVMLDGVRPTNGDANAPMLNVEAEFKGPFEKTERRTDGTEVTHLFSYAPLPAPCCFSGGMLGRADAGLSKRDAALHQAPAGAVQLRVPRQERSRRHVCGRRRRAGQPGALDLPGRHHRRALWQYVGAHAGMRSRAAERADTAVCCRDVMGGGGASTPAAGFQRPTPFGTLVLGLANLQELLEYDPNFFANVTGVFIGAIATGNPFPLAVNGTGVPDQAM